MREPAVCDFPPERRAHRRLPLSMTARVIGGPQPHRIDILDLSRGGLLLAASPAFEPAVGDTLRIEAVLIGQVQVEVVALSALGIHLKIRDASPDYDASVRRLSVLAETWSGERSATNP